VSEGLAITDPALLVRHVWPHGIEADAAVPELPSGRPARVQPRTKEQPKKFDIAYMPHFAEACTNGAAWKEICAELGVHYIDPTDRVDVVLNSILASKSLLAEAMHGAIVADAYRVPWTAIRTHSDINDAKWADWAMSMGMEDKPIRFWRPMYRLSKGNAVRRLFTATTYAQFKRAVATARPHLSADSVVQDRQELLLAMLHRCASAYPPLG
jgi:succinoglycan biosynthesis protein ExoV